VKSDKNKDKNAAAVNKKLMEQQEMPLTEEEMQEFIHIDDFVEEDEVITNKPKKEKKRAKDNKQQNANQNEVAKPAINTKTKSTTNGSIL
jgi:hypothetical protein